MDYPLTVFFDSGLQIHITHIYIYLQNNYTCFRNYNHKRSTYQTKKMHTKYKVFFKKNLAYKRTYFFLTIINI